jgi:hypothetical protein
MALDLSQSNNWGNQEFEGETSTREQEILYFMSVGPATLEVASIAGHIQCVGSTIDALRVVVLNSQFSRCLRRKYIILPPTRLNSSSLRLTMLLPSPPSSPCPAVHVDVRQLLAWPGLDQI